MRSRILRTGIPTLTFPCTVPHRRLKYARIRSEHDWRVDVVTVTVVVALLSHFYIQDVGVSVSVKFSC